MDGASFKMGARRSIQDVFLKRGDETRPFLKAVKTLVLSDNANEHIPRTMLLQQAVPRAVTPTPRETKPRPAGYANGKRSLSPSRPIIRCALRYRASSLACASMLSPNNKHLPDGAQTQAGTATHTHPVIAISSCLRMHANHRHNYRYLTPSPPP